MPTAYNGPGFAIFATTYKTKLAQAVVAHPEDYRWPASKFDEVAEKMISAIRAGSFNKDGHAFKATCKTLGIPHTYKAIRAFIEGRTESVAA